MRASYQGSEILNELSIKIAQFLDYFCKNSCFETLPFSKKRVTTVTHINLPVSIFDSLVFNGSPSQKFNSPWVEPFILLRNKALSLSFGVIRIRYKQKTRKHRSKISLMNRCLARLI